MDYYFEEPKKSKLNGNFNQGSVKVKLTPFDFVREAALVGFLIAELVVPPLVAKHQYDKKENALLHQYEVTTTAETSEQTITDRELFYGLGL